MVENPTKVLESKTVQHRMKIRFGLLSVLAVVTTLSLFLGGLSYLASNQRQKVKMLKACGAEIEFEVSDTVIGKLVSSLYGEECGSHIVTIFFGPWRDIQQATVLDYQPNQASDKELRACLSLGYKHLYHLDLQSTQLSDETLVALPHFPNLEQLRLSNTGITDASVDYLMTLGPLKYLSVAGTNISEEGREALREALPNCYVETEKHTSFENGTVIFHGPPIPISAE